MDELDALPGVSVRLWMTCSENRLGQNPALVADNFRFALAVQNCNRNWQPGKLPGVETKVRNSSKIH
jgi:hypothetical protein